MAATTSNWNWISYLFHSVPVPPQTVTLYLYIHNDGQCWPPNSFAVPLFPVSLLFFWVFPDLSVLSTLFFGQIRLSWIPDIPAAYVRNSIQLLWARTVSPSFPSLYPSPMSSASTHLHLARTGRGRTWLRCSPSPPLCLFFLFFGTSYPPFLLLLSSVLSLSEGVRHSHMTASVEGLETGFYTWGNSVKRDNTQSNTQKTELIWDCDRAFSATAGRIRKRKDMVELNGQDVWAGEK